MPPQHFEAVLIRLTPEEHQILIRLMKVQQQGSSDVLRELLGLPPEHEVEVTPTRPRLRLVSSALATTEHPELASGA
jgi:hypothetical protein